jgi:hypothetical protein
MAGHAAGGKDPEDLDYFLFPGKVADGVPAHGAQFIGVACHPCLLWHFVR